MGDYDGKAATGERAKRAKSLLVCWRSGVLTGKRSLSIDDWC